MQSETSVTTAIAVTTKSHHTIDPDADYTVIPNGPLQHLLSFARIDVDRKVMVGYKKGDATKYLFVYAVPQYVHWFNMATFTEFANTWGKTMARFGFNKIVAKLYDVNIGQLDLPKECNWVLMSDSFKGQPHLHPHVTFRYSGTGGLCPRIGNWVHALNGMYPDSNHFPRNLKIRAHVFEMDDYDYSQEQIARFKTYTEKIAQHYDRLDIGMDAQHCKQFLQIVAPHVGTIVFHNNDSICLDGDLSFTRLRRLAFRGAMDIAEMESVLQRAPGLSHVTVMASENYDDDRMDCDDPIVLQSLSSVTLDCSFVPAVELVRPLDSIESAADDLVRQEHDAVFNMLLRQPNLRHVKLSKIPWPFGNLKPQKFVDDLLSMYVDAYPHIMWTFQFNNAKFTGPYNETFSDPLMAPRRHRGKPKHWNFDENDVLDALAAVGKLASRPNSLVDFPFDIVGSQNVDFVTKIVAKAEQLDSVRMESNAFESGQAFSARVKSL